MNQKYQNMSDGELEECWQSQCQIIKTALTCYYKNGDEKLRKMAVDAQKRQSIVQEEITRRDR